MAATAGGNKIRNAKLVSNPRPEPSISSAYVPFLSVSSLDFSHLPAGGVSPPLLEWRPGSSLLGFLERGQIDIAAIISRSHLFFSFPFLFR